MASVEWIMRGQRGTWVVKGFVLVSLLAVVWILLGARVACAASWLWAGYVVARERGQLREHIEAGHNPEEWRDDAVGDSLVATFGAVIYTLGWAASVWSGGILL